MYAEDSNSGFEVFDFQKEKQSFKVVPDETSFKMKIVSNSGSRKILIKLPKGESLPCIQYAGGCKYFIHSTF